MSEARCALMGNIFVVEKGKRIKKEVPICSLAAEAGSRFCPRHTFLDALAAGERKIAETRKLAKQEAGVDGRLPMSRKDLEMSGYKFEDGADCRGCKAPIEWWMTPKGKLAPFDPMPGGFSTVTSHFATCPNVEDFRRQS